MVAGLFMYKSTVTLEVPRNVSQQFYLSRIVVSN